MNELGIVGCFAVLTVLFTADSAYPGQGSTGSRSRDLGIDVGVMTVGLANAITDVPGVAVGHQTIIRSNNVRTGVTAVLPHAG
ncbi:MAG: P1 family peptidase, partial [Candidatus Zixiibacteriota bacterium]